MNIHFSHQLKKFSSIAGLWKFLLLISILLIADTIFLARAINQQHILENEGLDLTGLSYDLERSSNFLTLSAQLFAETQKKKYLVQYWNEVNDTQTREKVLSSLNRYGNVNHTQLELLEEAKRKSDDLIETELRSMKLITIALNIPENKTVPQIQTYHLSRDDMLLPAADKINLAKKIMFDEAYSINKAKIIDPIKKFQEVTQHLSKKQLSLINKKISIMMLFLKILVALNFFAVLCLIWAKSL